MKLRHRGISTRIVVNGDEIQHQFKVGDYTLLITHYDYFDGVDYWFSLINNKNRVVDIVRGPNRNCFITLIEVREFELLFKYFDSDDIWSLEVFDKGSWKFKLFDIIRRHPKCWFYKKRIELINYGHKF